MEVGFLTEAITACGVNRFSEKDGTTGIVHFKQAVDDDAGRAVLLEVAIHAARGDGLGQKADLHLPLTAMIVGVPGGGVGPLVHLGRDEFARDRGNFVSLGLPDAHDSGAPAVELFAALRGDRLDIGQEFIEVIEIITKCRKYNIARRADRILNTYFSHLQSPACLWIENIYESQKKEAPSTSRAYSKSRLTSSKSGPQKFKWFDRGCALSAASSCRRRHRSSSDSGAWSRIARRCYSARRPAPCRARGPGHPIGRFRRPRYGASGN